MPPLSCTDVADQAQRGRRVARPAAPRPTRKAAKPANQGSRLATQGKVAALQYLAKRMSPRPPWGSGGANGVGGGERRRCRTLSPLSRPERARGSFSRRSGRTGIRPEPTVLDTLNVAQSAGNGLLTAMSLRPRVQEPTIRTRISKLRAWGLSLNRKRVRFLGFVDATDREAAKSAVVDDLALSHKQRKRLVVHELPGRVKTAAVSALNLKR